MGLAFQGVQRLRAGRPAQDTIMKMKFKTIFAG